MSHSSYREDDEEIHDEIHPAYDYEDSDELLEPAGFLNDLSYRDEEDRTIDLGEFFPISKAFAISHNKARVFSDMRSGQAKTLNFAKKRTLSLEKPKFKYHDILAKSRQSSGVLGYFKGASLLRINPVSLIAPLGELPENTLDVRTLEIIPVTQHADIYELPLSFSGRVRRFRRKHRKMILRTGIGLAGISIVFIGAVISGAMLAKTELEAGYKSLESLTKVKTFTEFQARSDEAGGHFRLAKPLLFMLGSLFDTPLYSSDQIRSAKALGDGGESITEAISRIQNIFAEVGKQGHIGSFDDIEQIFSSGSQVKITDILREHKSDISAIEKSLGEAVAAYSQVGNLGDDAMQQKFTQAVEMIFFAKEAISLYESHQDALLTTLGDERPMRYLVLNQNRDELRASGGFPGSAIFIELYKGRISKYEKRDIYYYDWHLFPFAEAAPE